MPVWFSMESNNTINLAGEKTIYICVPTNASACLTLAVTVVAAGGMLPELLVFKGKPCGRIANEFSKYPELHDFHSKCLVQKKRWMDEDIMIKWVDDILMPYLQVYQVNVYPVIYLDSYCCHMMESVVYAIEQLGVLMEHIPGGCTDLCQLVDVGIGQPLKVKIKDHYEDWMMQQDCNADAIFAPSCRIVASWVS